MNISVKTVPEELVRALKERAKANRRSLNSEILVILEESVWGPRPWRKSSPNESVET